MEFFYVGLKCDHCSYRDDTVPFSDYERSIGKPCPECSHSLLTQEDYDKCVRNYQLFDKLNAIGKVLRWINPFFYIRLIIKNPNWLKADAEFTFKNKHK